MADDSMHVDGLNIVLICRVIVFGNLKNPGNLMSGKWVRKMCRSLNNSVRSHENVRKQFIWGKTLHFELCVGEFCQTDCTITEVFCAVRLTGSWK